MVRRGQLRGWSRSRSRCAPRRAPATAALRCLVPLSSLSGFHTEGLQLLWKHWGPVGSPKVTTRGLDLHQGLKAQPGVRGVTRQASAATWASRLLSPWQVLPLRARPHGAATETLLFPRASSRRQVWHGCPGVPGDHSYLVSLVLSSYLWGSDPLPRQTHLHGLRRVPSVALPAKRAPLPPPSALLRGPAPWPLTPTPEASRLAE